jgi:hypothetical protein
MHKEHNVAAPVQKACKMCWFHSCVLHVPKNHIHRKHLDILKTIECNNCDYSPQTKGVLKHHKHHLYPVHVPCTCTLYLYHVPVPCTCTLYLYPVTVVLGPIWTNLVPI